MPPSTASLHRLFASRLPSPTPTFPCLQTLASLNSQLGASARVLSSAWDGKTHPINVTAGFTDCTVTSDGVATYLQVRFCVHTHVRLCFVCQCKRSRVVLRHGPLGSSWGYKNEPAHAETNMNQLMRVGVVGVAQGHACQPSNPPWNHSLAAVQGSKSIRDATAEAACIDTKTSAMAVGR